MQATTAHFTKLITNLQKQIQFSKIFITLLDNEQKALIDMNIGILMTLSKQKESGVRQMTYIDEQIQEATRAILDVPETESVNLQQVAAVLGEDDARKIEIGGALLKKLRMKIAEKNYINLRFTQDTLHYLGDAIRLISDGIATDPIYSIRGLGKAASVTPVLISREV